MENYLGYFLESGDQVVALAAAAVVWLGFTAIGAAVGGRRRLGEIDYLVGWSLVSFGFTFAGVFLRIPFTWLAAAAGFAAAVGAFMAWRRDRRLLPDGIGRIALLGLPFLIMVSAVQGSQWDEFTDWLVIPRYLLETDAFPSRDNPFSKAVFTGYPYSWHFVSYLVGRLAGGLIESAGALSNVILLFAYGLLMVRLMLTAAGRHPEAEPVRWSLAALAMLLVTLLNPTFAQKIVLTAYAETASAVAAGSALVLGWMVLEALAAREYDRARTLAWSMGLVLALLANLKQATLVLVVLIVLATAFVALRDRAVPLKRFVRLLGAMVLPTVAIYLAWRYHVATELTRGEMPLRPPGEWFIALIPQILAKMAIVLAKKGAYLALALAVIGFGVVGFWRARTSFDRLAALAALVMLGYNAFLLFAYLASFSKFDALRAASYWRYNMHLGGVVVAFAAYGGALLWRRWLSGRVRIARLAWLPVVLIIAAPFVFAPKLRFDREPMTRNFRVVGAAVAALAKPGDRIFNVDPHGSGESSAALTYELGERAGYAGQVSAFTRQASKAFRKALANPRTNALVLHTQLPDFATALGLTLPADRTYFLRRQADGAWRVVGSWPRPKGK